MAIRGDQPARVLELVVDLVDGLVQPFVRVEEPVAVEEQDLVHNHDSQDVHHHLPGGRQLALRVASPNVAFGHPSKDVGQRDEDEHLSKDQVLDDVHDAQLAGSVLGPVDHDVEEVALLNLVPGSEGVDPFLQLRIGPLQLDEEQEEPVEPIDGDGHDAANQEAEHRRRVRRREVRPECLECLAVESGPAQSVCGQKNKNETIVEQQQCISSAQGERLRGDDHTYTAARFGTMSHGCAPVVMVRRIARTAAPMSSTVPLLYASGNVELVKFATVSKIAHSNMVSWYYRAGVSPVSRLGRNARKWRDEKTWRKILRRLTLLCCVTSTHPRPPSATTDTRVTPVRVVRPGCPSSPTQVMQKLCWCGASFAQRVAQFALRVLACSRLTFVPRVWC